MKGLGCVILAGIVALSVVSCGPQSSGKSSTPAITSILGFSWRYSLMFDKTGVVQIRNLTDRATPIVTLHYRNQDSGQKSSYTVGAVAPHSMIEIGVMESGWTIEPNEVVTVTANGYDSQELYFFKNTKGEMIMSHGYGSKKTQQILERIEDTLK